MSRCFPYNPLSGCEERAALIEQIKLQKQEKAEEKKRNKRDKKHEKIHHVSNGRMEDAKQGHLKRKHGERKQVDQKGKGYAMAKCDESEQLEKSGLTEEYDLRYAASTHGQESPDSSQYTKKRKIDAPEINRISHGSLLLRIKVPALKAKEPELPAFLPVSAEQPCFSGRMETAVTQEQQHTKIVIQGQDHQRCPVDELNVSKGFRGGKKSRKRENKYTELFANWDHQPPQMEMIDDSQDWLFGKSTGNHRTEQDTNRCRGESKLSVVAAVLPAWPPRACFLPESDVYVLPYVVPF